VTDPNANRATIRGMELYGARVIVVEDRDPVGGIWELGSIGSLSGPALLVPWPGSHADLSQLEGSATREGTPNGHRA
jgi:hypothetical protein